MYDAALGGDMEKPSVKCALIATMIAKHKWGSPIDEDALLRLSPIDNAYPTARKVYSELREKPYIIHRGSRGIELNQTHFYALAEVLYHDCGWEPWEIDSRLRHYEGIDEHDWSD